MPSVFATLKVRADKVAEAKKALVQLQEHVRRSEPGNLAYIFHQRKDDPTIFMAYEKYAGEEAFAAHRQAMASTPVDLRGILDGAPQIVLVEEI